MQTPAVPADEKERIAALRALELLDTAPEERFDRITRLARRLFDVPRAFVSLIDAERQWFKSTCGFRALGSTPRETSFCGHAILGDEALIITDARTDGRFIGNPHVISDPWIVFYAGQPLRGPGGQKVGALCLVDRRPRGFDAEDRTLLADLGALVERELNLEEAFNYQQRRLRRAREAADQGARAKSQFLANMSHELRTPLNAIIGYSEMLIEDADAQTAPDLQMILTSGERLLGMLDRLLDFSRAQADKLTLNLEEFDPCEITAELAELFELPAARQENTLTVDCPPTGLVRGDPAKVRQILANLLDNACKFTHGGKVSLRGWREDGPDKGARRLVFEIADTGLGMNEAQQSRLFETFYQADGDYSRTHGGVGLGLAIAQRLCELMGGTISVRSAPGEGSAFTVRVPVE